MRANKMCASCPFRGADEAYRRESAHIPADDWPCHTEDLHGVIGVQCRGHFEARRKYPVSASASAAYMEQVRRQAEALILVPAIQDSTAIRQIDRGEGAALKGSGDGG